MILCPLLPAFFFQVSHNFMKHCSCSVTLSLIFSFPLSFLSFSPFLSARARCFHDIFSPSGHIYSPPPGGGVFSKIQTPVKIRTHFELCKYTVQHVIIVFVVAGIHFSNGRLLRGRHRLHRYGFALHSEVNSRFSPTSDSHRVLVDILNFLDHRGRRGKLGVMYKGQMFGTALECSVVDPDPAFEVNLDPDTDPQHWAWFHQFTKIILVHLR